MYKHLIDKVLVEETKNLVMVEHKTTAQILKYLEEIDRRKLYVDYGHPSLIKFCVKELKYSEGAAYRRIVAARLIREIPEALPLLSSGNLTLSNTAKISEYCKAEKIGDRDTKKNLIREIVGKTTRETEEKLLSKCSANSTFRRKNILKRISQNDFELNITISHSLKENLEKVKNIKSHTLGNWEEVLNFMAEQTLRNITAEKKTRKSETKARCATANIKSVLLKKADFRCEYIDPKLKKRCESQSFLQADHILPAHYGGKTEASNMRILCAAHNLRRNML